MFSDIETAAVPTINNTNIGLTNFEGKVLIQYTSTFHDIGYNIETPMLVIIINVIYTELKIMSITIKSYGSVRFDWRRGDNVED